MSKACNLCNSQNIVKNNILDKNICAYCYFNFGENASNDILNQADIFNLFKKFYSNKTKYNNSALVSSNSLIKADVQASVFEEYGENIFNKKNASKLLSSGKIDSVIIPDLSNVCLKSIFSIQELFSKNIDLHIGVFTPHFILSNIEQFKKVKYIYSLVSLSKISILNNFDIYNIHHDTDYMILNIRREINNNTDIAEKLQNLWDLHAFSSIFDALK
jgi:hypothetical protein